MPVKFHGGGGCLESGKGGEKEKKGDSKSCRQIVDGNIYLHMYYLKYTKYIENYINQLPVDDWLIMMGPGSTLSLH